MTCSANAQLNQYKAEVTKRLERLNRNTDLLVSFGNLGRTIAEISRNDACNVEQSENSGDVKVARHALAVQAIKCRVFLFGLQDAIGAALTNAKSAIESPSADIKPVLSDGEQALKDIRDNSQRLLDKIHLIDKTLSNKFDVRAQPNRWNNDRLKIGPSYLWRNRKDSFICAERINDDYVKASALTVDKAKNAINTSDAYEARRAMAEITIRREIANVIAGFCGDSTVESRSTAVRRSWLDVAEIVQKKSVDEMIATACEELADSEIWGDLCRTQNPSLQLEYALHLELEKQRVRARH